MNIIRLAKMPFDISMSISGHVIGYVLYHVFVSPQMERKDASITLYEYAPPPRKRNPTATKKKRAS